MSAITALSPVKGWDNLTRHFNLHNEEAGRLDFASAANRFIAWPAILSLAGASVRTGSVIDFGCGTGGLSALLHQMGWKVRGIDRSSEMVECARAYTHESIEYVVGAVDSLTLSSEADLVCCSLVLNYFEDLTPFMEAARQALKPGGLLVTADLNRPYIAACLAAGLFYEDFDSPEQPSKGILNFGEGVRIPLTVRDEREYDTLFLSRGWQKAGALYPDWPHEYVRLYAEQFPDRLPLNVPKYQVTAYRKST